MFCGCLKKTNTVMDNCNKINDIIISNKLHKHFLKYNNSEVLFDINEYNPKKLGEGSSATTYKIIIENDEFTCKCYKKIKKEYENQRFKEIEILKQIQSKRFPSFCTYLKQLDMIYVFYDYINGNDLFEILDKYYNKINNINSQLTIIYEITKGLYTLSQHNLIHLDLKPENIIIINFNPIKLKLIDLECVHNTQKSKIQRDCGTIGYTPPEVILHKKYYYNSDIWSLGCIFFLLLTHYQIFPTESESYVKNIESFISIYNIDNMITNILNKLPNDISDLLNRMLKYEHTERINISQILKSKIMKNLIKNKLQVINLKIFQQKHILWTKLFLP